MPRWRARHSITWISLLGFLAKPSAAQQSAVPNPEAHVSLDLKDAPIANVVALLGEVGGFQTVVDPDVSCALTLKLRDARWQQALEASLRACRLGYEGPAPVLRIAPVQRLAEESTARRRLEEARQPSREPVITMFRLSYARAAEIAPLLKRYLSARGQVSYDTRTNTLIVVD
jgi:type II secretory pathway component HofQ